MSTTLDSLRLDSMKNQMQVLMDSIQSTSNSSSEIQSKLDSVTFSPNGFYWIAIVGLVLYFLYACSKIYFENEDKKRGLFINLMEEYPKDETDKALIIKKYIEEEFRCQK